MQLTAHTSTASRFSVALLGAALLTVCLFYGLQGLIKPADLQTQYFQIKSTIARTAERSASTNLGNFIPVKGIQISFPEELETYCFCHGWPFDPKAALADWRQSISPVDPQNIYYLPLKTDQTVETVFRATVLMRDMPAFAEVKEQQRVHLAFAVVPNGTVDTSSVTVLSASDDTCARTAQRMLKSWTYQPTLENGVPVRQDNMEVVFIIEPAADE